MKVLFVGDASNMHNCLAKQLRRMGHEAVVASNGSTWMNTERDINLLRHPGKLGAVRYVYDILKALPQMRGFDIVQLAGPIFLNLKPSKVRWVLDYLKRHNSHVVLSAIGTDRVYYDACHDGHTYRYSDYMLGDKPSPYVLSQEYRAQQQDNWSQDFMKEHSDYVLNAVDGVAACLWEYFVAYEQVGVKKLVHTGLPIDVDSLTLRELDSVPNKVRFFIGIQRDRTALKGTDRMLAALKRVCAARPDECEMVVAESVPYAQYVNMMRSSHVILDQLYSYTPATNALLAMAQGLVAVSGAEPEYYELIGETENQPIVNVNPLIEGDIEAKLNYIIDNKDHMPEWSLKSREFVLKHNSASIVAQRYLDLWNSIINGK
ncbi:MAG: glycosyltransferase family 1 protein [Bacteroidales bacterium]|nr:glycosyltransferase family 1 protein [Candidatus Sodaliphilus fimicaballi]